MGGESQFVFLVSYFYIFCEIFLQSLLRSFWRGPTVGIDCDSNSGWNLGSPWWGGTGWECRTLSLTLFVKIVKYMNVASRWTPLFVIQKVPKILQTHFLTRHDIPKKKIGKILSHSPFHSLKVFRKENDSFPNSYSLRMEGNNQRLVCVFLCWWIPNFIIGLTPSTACYLLPGKKQFFLLKFTKSVETHKISTYSQGRSLCVAT